MVTRTSTGDNDFGLDEKETEGKKGPGLTSKFLRGQTGKRPNAALQRIVEVSEEKLSEYGLDGLAIEVINTQPLIAPVLCVMRIVNRTAYIYNTLLLDAILEPTCLEPSSRAARVSQSETRTILNFPSWQALADDCLIRTVESHIRAKYSNIDEILVCNSAVSRITLSQFEEAPEKFFPYLDTAALTFQSVSVPNGALTVQDIKDSHNTEVCARFDVASGAIDYNIVDQPIASDFTVTTSLREPTNVNGQSQRASWHSDNQEIVLSKTSVVADFVRTPIQPGMAPANQAIRGYAANLVITDISSGIGNSVTTEGLETILFGVANVAMMSMNSQWHSVYLDPEVSALSAFGMIYDPVLGRVPEKPAPLNIARPGATPKNGQETTTSVLTNFVHPNALVSIDIEPAGRNYGFMTMLLDAVQGGEDGEGYTRLNKRISKFLGRTFDPKVPVSMGYLKIIPTGTYLDERSRLNDSRHWTLLRTMSACKGDMNTHNEYNEVNGFMTPSMELPAALLWRQLNAIQTLKYDNIRARLTFNPAWLGALMSAMNDSGMRFTYEGLYAQESTTYFDPSLLRGFSLPTEMYTMRHNTVEGNQMRYAGYHAPNAYGR